MIGPHEVLQLLYQHAHPLLMPGASTSDKDWKDLEAYLFLMAAVTDRLAPTETTIGESRIVCGCLWVGRWLGGG